MAKAIHVPVRRREEQVAQPSMAMKAAAVNLAVVLRRNFDFQVGRGSLCLCLLPLLPLLMRVLSRTAAAVN